MAVEPVANGVLCFGAKAPWPWTMSMIQYSDTCGASLVAQTVKILPIMQDTQVQSLGWEDPLEEGIFIWRATHSSILALRILWTEEPCRLQSMALQIGT